MPALKNYRLFISHSWDYNDEYNRFVNLIKDESYFQWQNYSIPDHNPLGTKTDRELKEALTRKIRPVNLVIILAGMYINHSKWIQIEMNIARSLSKPMIGIMPWGSQRIPQEVQNIAKEMVGWNTNSIISAIRRNSM